MTENAPTLEDRKNRYSALIDSMRQKDPCSTFLERVILFDEAGQKFGHLPQPQCFGEGIYYVLDHLSLPVREDDLLLGRVQETVPDERQEAYFQSRMEAWGGRSCPPWARDGSHETLAWERLVSLGLPGLEDHARQCLAPRRAGNEKSVYEGTGESITCKMKSYGFPQSDRAPYYWQTSRRPSHVKPKEPCHADNLRKGIPF